MIIAEKTIQTILEQLETETSYQMRLLEQFETKYEDFLAYLGQEILSILNEKEGDLLLFILSVLEEAFQRHNPTTDLFELNQYFDTEERMWTVYEEQLKLPFRDRITPYFESIDEEEALAFIEDLLTEDEEDEDPFLGNTGRDIIWNCSAAFVSVSK